MRVEFQKSTFRNILLSLARWFDSYAGTEEMASAPEKKVDFLRVLPFVLLHVSCLGIYRVGWSPVAVGTAAGLYLIRMFAITAFCHRYAVSARQGFFWWEVDLTYYGLVVLSWLGIVRDLRPVPEAVRRPETVPA
jgi:fatty-acid desaturase